MILAMALALGAGAIIFVALRFKQRFEAYQATHGREETPGEPVLDGSLASPGVPTVLPSAAPQTISYSPETQAKIRTLDEILRSKNDNDPRLDRDFRNLSPEAKSALRAHYAELPPEDRNGRGTIVFLLGREASQPEDLQFFQQILSEPPCRSFSDCTKEPGNTAHEDVHLESANEVTLAYPQLVALKWIDELLSRPGTEALTPAMREAAMRAIQAAKDSGNPLVAKKGQMLSQEAEKKLGNRP